MSKMTDTLQEMADEIFQNGCTRHDDACWTGRTASRIVFDDNDTSTEQEGEEYLYFEFSDGEGYVWYPEDSMAKAPSISHSDMSAYYND